jgi:hypothetical protein
VLEVAVKTRIHDHVSCLDKIHSGRSFEKSACRDDIRFTPGIGDAVSCSQKMPASTQQNAGTLDTRGTHVHGQTRDPIEAATEWRNEIYRRTGGDEGEERTSTPNERAQ